MRAGQVRDVTFFDLVILSNPEYGLKKNIVYFLDKIKELYDANETAVWNRNRTRKIIIRDMEIDLQNNQASLLFYYNDGNAPGASFAHLDTDHHRDEHIQGREGRPESVHMVLTLESASEQELRYFCVLEDGERLTRASVQSYLNKLVKEIVKKNKEEFRSLHPDGSVNRHGEAKTYISKNRLELQGYLASDFREMLRDGKLKGICLETHRITETGFGEGIHVKAKRKELLLATEGKWSEQPLLKLSEALKVGRENSYEYTRVIFDAPDGKPYSVRIHTANQTIMGDKFIEKRRIKGFSSILAEAHKEFHPEILEKMKQLF